VLPGERAKPNSNRIPDGTLPSASDLNCEHQRIVTAPEVRICNDGRHTAAAERRADSVGYLRPGVSHKAK